MPHRLLPLFVLLSLAGCSLLPGAADPKLVGALSKETYPADAPLGEDLDVLVVVDGSSLQLVNRTPNTYEHMLLWLDQQWVGNVERIAIGTDNHLNLGKFINRHGEPFPTGTFLHPDRAFPVVLAELYDPAANVRHRLLARVTGL
ncbi:MAG: hypothetical protein WD042_17385 [Phycisphaeraceae bacterium]